MKKLTALTFVMLLVAGLFAAAPSGYAQTTDASTGKPPSVLDRIRKKLKEKQTPEDRAKRWFDNLDADKNEEITKQELFESIRRRFDGMDGNRDRHVSKSEYLRLRKDRQIGERRFGELDSNADGRLSLPEFASPADWRFDRIDRNLDGKVSRTEAARLFDRPTGEALPKETGECFYVDRQIVRVQEDVAETFKQRGYPKADCRWQPDTTEQEKTKKF
ncbi:MAG: EF-hand domain-containing protein [Alphaproteobacteria bacterium]